MNTGKDFSAVVDLIREEDSRFEKGAYYFVRHALDHTLKTLQKASKAQGSLHVSGQELLKGIREFALEQYGPLARTVLHHWNIRQCSDFGDIVFNLVEYGVLGKTESDRPEDFKEGFDFADAFEKPFLPEKENPEHSRLRWKSEDEDAE